MDGNPFLKVQRLGRALMLPIAVLPVAVFCCDWPE